jgi:hypothetical protein
MAYTYQPEPASYNFSEAFERLQAPRKMMGHPDSCGGEVCTRIEDALFELSIVPRPMVIDVAKYSDYVSSAGYDPHYYPVVFKEKSAEHFLSLEALEMDSHSVFVDIAAEHSPLGAIATQRHGCTAFAQDIMFEPGVHGNRIGGDACAMPVGDGFFTHACLTCSLEHFEEDADTRLFRELARVIRPGGRVVVVPLYLFTSPAVLTDPRWSLSGKVAFDSDATVYCSDGWGNRHGRYYSAHTLWQRLIDPTPEFRFVVYRLLDHDLLDPSVYARWLLVAERQ